MNWTHILRAAALTGILAGTALAEQVDGILITTMCAAKAVKEGGDAAAKHERTCNLKPNCAKTGFGVLTPDNRFFQFDEAGNAKALKALQESAKKDDMKVVVTGDVQGDKIAVSSLKLEN
ncbi:MAG TPA: hypothetical protein VKX39_12495 [Bryobacteraceae bacterium]|jgi:hypothetical protein|nr:hypothetical protein [Bryobacteraceae bacterium]